LPSKTLLCSFFSAFSSFDTDLPDPFPRFRALFLIVVLPVAGIGTSFPVRPAGGCRRLRQTQFFPAPSHAKVRLLPAGRFLLPSSLKTQGKLAALKGATLLSQLLLLFFATLYLAFFLLLRLTNFRLLPFTLIALQACSTAYLL
jgi:hypothetical protein